MLARLWGVAVQHQVRQEGLQACRIGLYQRPLPVADLERAQQLDVKRLGHHRALCSPAMSAGIGVYYPAYTVHSASTQARGVNDRINGSIDEPKPFHVHIISKAR